jgi:hypothetical protein
MERTEAFKTLRLDQSADGRMVEHAYWTLVRQAQGRGSDEIAAKAEIDSLNRAYALLSPDGKRAAPLRHATLQAGPAPVAERIADWLAEEALRARARWSHRNPEIAVIGLAVVVLMFLALSAGASVFLTFFAVFVVLAAVWAPWRRVPPADDGS